MDQKYRNSICWSNSPDMGFTIYMVEYIWQMTGACLVKSFMAICIYQIPQVGFHGMIDN